VMPAGTVGTGDDVLLAAVTGDMAVTVLAISTPVVGDAETFTVAVPVWSDVVNVVEPTLSATVVLSSAPSQCAESDVEPDVETSDESYKQPSITDDDSSNSDTVAVLVGERRTNNSDAVAFSEVEKCSDKFCAGAFSVAEKRESDLSQRYVGKTLKSSVKHGRSKKVCPVEDCGSEVIHLPRHLRLTHQWSKERARTAIQHFNLRKTYTYSNTLTV